LSPVKGILRQWTAIGFINTSHLKNFELAKMPSVFPLQLCAFAGYFIAPAKQQRRKEESKVFLR
jgi:hypothetical protein